MSNDEVTREQPGVALESMTDPGGVIDEVFRGYLTGLGVHSDIDNRISAARDELKRRLCGVTGRAS